MSSSPLLSVIINCFNGEKYLSECLKSILLQTYENYEVIFWDNKSSDNSKNIFLEIKDKRFKYFTDDNHVSLHSARNKALNFVKGKYISFLDVDDKFFPEKLKLQVEIMQSNPKIGFCYSGFKFLSEKSGEMKSAYDNKNLKSGYITSDLLKNYNVGLLTLMLNKKILDSNNIKFDGRFNIIGDLDLVLRLSKVSLGVPIRSDLAICRKHTNNLSNRVNLFVKERKIWYEEMLSLKLFNYKELIPFVEETKYMELRNEIKNLNFFKAIKKLIFLKGIFLIKGSILYVFQLIKYLIYKTPFKFFN